MGTNRRQFEYSGNRYIDGSAARKINRAVPITRPERTPREEYEHSQVVRRNQEKALHMDGAYVFALTIAAVITLALCLNYLHMQSSITTRINNIETLELKLENLKSTNDALQTRLDTYADLDHVYEVATKELGMVYANKDQILLYNRSESEYVRQYEDIPKHK